MSISRRCISSYRLGPSWLSVSSPQTKCQQPTNDRVLAS
jgi:hypothetical protein